MIKKLIKQYATLSIGGAAYQKENNSNNDFNLFQINEQKTALHRRNVVVVAWVTSEFVNILNFHS